MAYQVPPSMEFSRQEYWSRLPFPSPGDLPDPGTEPLEQGLVTFSVNCQTVNILGFMDHIMATIQICHQSIKAAIHNM